MENKILTYDSVEISFDGEAVVHDVSFSLTPGEILGLVGESGSGKSTLIKAAMGLLGSGGLVTRGDICYMGQNILDISEKEKRKIRGAGIGMIFQDAGASLCPIRTIGDQIYESMRAHKKVSRNEAKDRAMELFEKLNFKDSQRVWDSYPFELSGGMNQRAGIAIAMLMNPPVLFADEPTSALDVSVQAQVINLLNKLKGEMGLTILFIAHNLSVVKYFSNRIGVMYFGKLVEMADSEELFKNPLHPYTKALLSAIPEPDPRKEKKRVKLHYDPEMHHYSESNRPFYHEVSPGHTIYCSDEEFEEYRKEWKP